MAKYAVTYEEVYQKTFIVEADSPEESDLYSNFETTRRNKYYYTYEVIHHLLKKYGLKRIEIENDKIGYDFIMNVIYSMNDSGLIVTERDFELIRSLNKTEKKRVVTA